MKKEIYLLLVLCIMSLSFRGHSQSIIASFEDEKDLLNVGVTEGIDISRTTDFAALGAFSCKVVYPENGGVIYLNNIESIFLGNVEASSVNQKEVLLCFVWTNNVANINILVEDSQSQTYDEEFPLKQGVNHLQLSLDKAQNVDWNNIKSIGIRAKKENILYIDYVALDQYQPVLDKLGRWDVEYATKIETSHYNWGNDFVNGPIKSYSISPVFDGRGIIELAQRLDLDLKVTTIGRGMGAEKYGYGDFYMRRSPGHGGDSSTYNLAHNYIAQDLLFSPGFDVIIWPGLHKWDSYPMEVRNTILERVKNGTGLVLLYPVSEEGSDLSNISPLESASAFDAQAKVKDAEILTIPEQLDKSPWQVSTPHYISRGVAFEAFPWGSMGVYPYKPVQGEVIVKSTKGNPVVSLSTYGKGRVVAMAYPERGFLPSVDDPWETGLNYPYWEYIWSMLARSVIWAADKEPDNFINKIKRTSQGISVDLYNNLEEASLNIQVLDDFGIVEEEAVILLDPKQKIVEVPFQNNLNGGNHIVNVSLKDDKGVYDWYSFTFDTPKVAEIVSIDAMELEIPVGQKVKSTVVIKSDSPVKATLTASLHDNYGRLVDEIIQELTIEGEKKIDVILNSKNIITNLGKLEYLLDVNGRQADHKVKELFFLQPRVWDDYDVTMYHFGPNPVPGVWPAIDHQLQELNVTTLAAYTMANSKHANYKVQAQTRISGVESPDSGPDLAYYEDMISKYLQSHDKRLLVRKYGLKDTVYLNSVRDDLITKVGEWKKFSPSAYYIYEEPSITRYNGALDLDFSEISLKAMREWLKGRYPSLNALNDQWGTNFTQWTEVIPDDSFEARERGNYSSWADHRSFMEVCWADQFKLVQETVNEIDPGGLVQLSGTQAASSHNGYDYSLINQYIGQMNPYDIDNQLEYHLTFNPDLKVSGQAGYGALGKGVLYDYYHHLFLKETGGSYVFWQASSMNPDLQVCQAGKVMKEGFDEMLKRGIGRLISSYDPENELKIAVHYSYPSVHAAWIVDGEIVDNPGNNSKTLLQYNRNRDGWVKVLHDMGMGFEFIAYSNIEEGGLISNGYKVLILPMSYAISDKEVTQIEEFVRQGGILMADALSGVMDEHTRFRSKRALADIFGIKSRAYSREELTTPKAESELKIKRADVLGIGSNQEVLINKYGDGTAYLLNYFMDGYPEEKSNEKNGEALSKIRSLFDNENLTSGIRITKPSGEQENGIEKYAFSHNNSTTRLLGLLPGRQGKNRKVLLQLDESLHVYDVRNMKYLGKGDQFNINIKNTVPELFGLLPGVIDSIKVKAPVSVNRGKELNLDFEIIGEEVSTFNSVATIEVFDPNGERVNYYSKNHDIINGYGSCTFHLALNDPTGPWKIRLTEVITGVEKEISVNIK